MCYNLKITQAPKINLKKLNKKLDFIKCMNVIQYIWVVLALKY